MSEEHPVPFLKACVDVDYREQEAVSACLLFGRWEAERPTRTLVERIAPVAPYVPGEFYRRELPCLLATLRPFISLVDVVIVDGYVWLGEALGLGARLYEALGRRAAVIGVAKSAFHGAPATSVQRGPGRRPLYVTAAGMSAEEAAGHIREMHGEYRLPTLLRQVDQLCRRA
ncbi:endonuclease V [Deinococcus apachensis]|uniref:endonuclease V n=1 Tax=Deinococcus apachensis TaxID=309886 RepID=UPI00037FBCD2|nr:endonuclease V [Deinococcus apachensis]